MALSAPRNASAAASSSPQRADSAGFEGAINHLFLPPKLPHGEDPDEVESRILDITIKAVADFRRLSPSHVLDRVASLLRTFRAVHTSGRVNEANLLAELHALHDGDTIPLQITAQNAVILITRQQGKLIFEAFELSPKNDAVYSTPGRLLRTFPAMAISVDASILQQHDFADTIANTLCTMSRQQVAKMQPESRKAGQKHEEDRDTIDPAVVCGLLFGILRGFSSSHSVSTIGKHTRDEVLWNNTRRPWRRSPMWLLLRVILQLTMSRASKSGDALYKKLIIFILSHTLDTALDMDLSSELYYAMNAKIERRRHKLLLEDSLDDPIGTSIADTLKRSGAKLESRWKILQDRNARTLNLQVLKDLDFRKDTLVAIPQLDRHIDAIASRQRMANSISFKPTTALIQHARSDSLPSLPSSLKNDYAAANLQQFEQWIMHHLRGWANATADDTVCEGLSRLIQSYHSLACSLYANNPEGISTMLLTIYEMWMRFDQAAVRKCPMLADYEMGVASGVLENLLLPFREQMHKLSEIEKYLDRRSAGTDSAKLFTTDGQGFASRYFDSSNSHQALLQRINTDAQTDRQNKINELQRQQNEYRRLDALYRSSECEYRTIEIDTWCDPPETERVHQSTCKKCQYGRERDDLKILVHEWPVPTNATEAKAVIFELDVPGWFADWREARAYLLYDVLKGKSSASHLRASFELSSNDPHLKKHYRSKNNRIGLLSEDKPMVVTHYREQKLSTCDQSSVCVRNGLKYRYYDSSAGGFVQKPFFDHSMQLKCTYKLPTEVKSLQRFIFRPSSSPDGPAPNEVIAGQGNCPDGMSLEEYKELSTVPLGHRIQWANILVQLAMPGVDFKKPETTLTFLQCIYQAGPPSASGDVLREAHGVFCDDIMAQSVLENLQHALQRVKENWESAQALNIFIAIATRTLSLNESVRDACLLFLKSARTTAGDWIRVLREKAHAATDHPSRTAFISKSVEIALICASSFDVDDRHLQAVLSSPEQTSLLHWCAIVVHEGKQTDATKTSNLALLDLRFKRLLHRTCHHLLQDPDGLNIAVKQAWSAFLPGGAGWKQVSKDAMHWLTTTTAAHASDHSIRVHYDLLTGELLANGLPLDQPPTHYRNKPLYQTLFGKAIVEVMPAIEPGFQFSTKRTFGGDFQVQLGMFNDCMIVQAKNSEGLWETIPTEALQGAYPAHFSDKFVFWYCAAKNEVHLRPVEDPWSSKSPRNCILSHVSSQSWILSSGDRHVLGLSSETSKALAAVLCPLAAPPSIHCLLNSGDRSLSVEIPSIRLNFLLSNGSTDLQSCEYRGRFVDQNQRLGTLVGFSNKLLLISKDGENRLAILLESDLSYSKKYGHTVVEVQNRAEAKVHAVEVDTSLCRLQDSGLDCKLYLAYLHALTSFCLPDPLTHRTGTEQALTILRSKAVQSFDQLTQDNVDLLGNIADLTPVRAYYPLNKREMQRVDWDDRLSFLSQHGHFSEIVSSLFRQSLTAQLFFPDMELSMPRLKETPQELRIRDKIRSSSSRVSGFGADEFDTSYDQAYDSRERAHLTPRAQDAAFISNILSRDGHELHYASLPGNRIWQLMQGSSLTSIHGASTPIDPSRLRYDAELLKTGFQQAIAKFPSLHRWSKDPQAQALSNRKFLITVWISTLAFAEVDTEFLQLLALCFKSPQLAGIASPQPMSFKPAQSPSDGSTISQAEITQIVRRHTRAFDRCPEYSLPRRTNERKGEYASRRNNAWQTASQAAVHKVSHDITNQWRCEAPREPTFANASTYIDMTKVMADITAKFRIWYDNSLLYEYLADVERAIKCLNTRAVQLPAMDLASSKSRTALPGFIAEKDLFSHAAPLLSVHESSLHTDTVLPIHGAAKVASEPLFASFLRKLRSSLGQSNVQRSTYEASYIGDLERSLGALVLRNEAQQMPEISVSEAMLDAYLAQCQHNADSIYSEIISSMREKAGTDGNGQQFPRVSPAFLLKQLAHDRWNKLSDDWKECIVTYGLALTEMQRAKRLSKLGDGSRKAELISELSNVGHKNWSPLDHPESLLIEIETGIMIREVQEQIAQEMRAPSCGSNAVCQLNMGEGKSSVIVPIVAAGLANGSQLVRVVVGKPQSKQMAQMLISKMGGLVGRRIYFMPFSRSLKVDREGANAISNMLHECMTSGGILLVQPEHILSFKLMAPECYISGKPEVGRSIMSTQDFLDRHARDIVDESDENFSTRFELIYTMGMQRSIELSPGRWFLLQQVLELVRKVAPEIASQLPNSIEISAGINGAFAKVRLLRQDAEEMLVHCIAKCICQQGIEGFHLGRQPSNVRDAVYTYISKFELSISEMDAVENSSLWTETAKPQLLMLRGLLAGGVLSFTLAHKRWRVNYGLACRTPPTRLAVPYRAKDSPTPRSEFSHPDVVITLTSLCYYYEGLSDEDLFTAMGHLMDSDQSDTEYQVWVKDSAILSPAFKQLQGINLKDRPQCVDELFPSLRFGKSVVDYFLSRIVFPKEMKEFPHKLSASGWDIGKARQKLTTGFSGTNDSRHLLPLDVKHLDLPHQKHTNALVLDYLLQPQNGVHLMSTTEPGQTGPVSDARRLLDSVMRLNPAVQVILDVGAQILELTNLQMSQTWLKLHDSSKEAVVFVNDDDEICVVDRQGRVDLLQTSSYQSRLDSCLVFLDEAHTRGIDIRLPTHYRASVTLGANLTKDRLVQACMRLRKLGKGQTVVFCISEEIQAKILEATSKSSARDIEVADVLEWSIKETHSDTRRNMPLWAVQGERFIRQAKLWKAAQDQDGNTTMTKENASAFLEDEAQTIEDRYLPRRSHAQPSYLSDTTDPDLQQIGRRCRAFDDLRFDAGTLQEEQERELSPEIEQERQVQRAPPAEPAQHRLHEHVVLFAATGKILPTSLAYSPAFTSLRFTGAGKVFPTSILRSEQLLVTADFAQTVEHKGASFVQDAFLRPVQWLLTRCAPGSNVVQYIMVISPFEANQLYRNMQKSAATMLHVYKPRVNSGFSALPIGFHTVPARNQIPSVPTLLGVQLNVFSGALYFQDIVQYKEVCKFLGMAACALTPEMEKQGWKVDADGFIISDDQGRVGGESSLAQSPVAFIKALLAMRRNGEGVSKTHLGALLEGKLFEESDFD